MTEFQGLKYEIHICQILVQVVYVGKHYKGMILFNVVGLFPFGVPICDLDLYGEKSRPSQCTQFLHNSALVTLAIIEFIISHGI